MKKLNKQSAEVFNKLVSMLGNLDSMKIDNSDGTFMPLCFEKLTELDFMGHPATVYGMAHYFELNGDLVPDPDMTFIHLVKTPDFVFPASITNQFTYKESIWLCDDRWKYNQAEQLDQTRFANMWLKNIKKQQEL